LDGVGIFVGVPAEYETPGSGEKRIVAKVCRKAEEKADGRLDLGLDTGEKCNHFNFRGIHAAHLQRIPGNGGGKESGIPEEEHLLKLIGIGQAEATGKWKATASGGHRQSNILAESRPAVAISSGHKFKQQEKAADNFDWKWIG